MWPCGRRRTSLHFPGPRETRPLLSADEEKERKRCDLRARLRDRQTAKGGREERGKNEGRRKSFWRATTMRSRRGKRASKEANYPSSIRAQRADLLLARSLNRPCQFGGSDEEQHSGERRSGRGATISEKSRVSPSKRGT